MIKVSFPTKLLSNRHYISEISVEGKRTPKFFFKIGWYDLYMSQIIRSGNCITLLSSIIEITRDNFWNTHYFEDITRHLFWTFNKSFLLILAGKIDTLDRNAVSRCLELLTHNFIPYQEASFVDNPDEELQWCLVKNTNLLKDKRFRNMYTLDEQNRTALLEALQKRHALLQHMADEKKDTAEPDTQMDSGPSFLETFNPIHGQPEEMLRFMIQKVYDAGFDYNIFSPVKRLPSGKNQYKLNG